MATPEAIVVAGPNGSGKTTFALEYLQEYTHPYLSADACVARLLERVRKGGHAVPESDARRRFHRSIRNFWNVYRPLVSRGYLYYNGGAQFHEMALGQAETAVVRDEELLARFLEIAEGDPNG